MQFRLVRAQEDRKSCGAEDLAGAFAQAEKLLRGVNAADFDAIIAKGPIQMRGVPPEQLFLLSARAEGLKETAGHPHAHAFESHQVQQKFADPHTSQSAQSDRVGG